MAAWRAVAVKARRGGRRATLGIEAPLIGRDEELALLKETVRRTVVDGRPHLVTVVGSAGVGKSRLTWELEKYLDGLPDVYHWRKGRCLAYAQAPYSALADAVKQDARILDDDSPDTVDRQDRAPARRAGADDPELLVAIRALLGLGAVGEQPRERLFEAWRRYLEHIAAATRSCSCWRTSTGRMTDCSTPSSSWPAGRRADLMLLCLARHELLERRPTWGGGIPNATTIVLEPLDAAKSIELVDGLLPGGLPAPLRDRVVSLAEGNPLFAEELVRMFVDRGVLRYADGAWEQPARSRRSKCRARSRRSSRPGWTPCRRAKSGWPRMRPSWVGSSGTPSSPTSRGSRRTWPTRCCAASGSRNWSCRGSRRPWRGRRSSASGTCSSATSPTTPCRSAIGQ